ncbi:hypothetical protein JOM56_005430 [Amanita muscaria]
MKVLTFLASAVYLVAVLSFPLSDRSGGVKGVTDEYVNATVINTFIKRQNKKALSSIIGSIFGTANKEGYLDRGQFTIALVDALWNNNRNYNYVICHVAHAYAFEGTQGVDWDHDKIKIAPKNSPEIGFDIIVGGAGTFVRQGDGGYINWAYKGYASRKDVGRETIVTFTAPP